VDTKLKDILVSQRTKTHTVLSCLIAIQERLGYLPPEAIPAVAEYTGASVNEVWGVATFYTHFRFEPPGRHQIELCRGPSCHIFNSQRLMRLAEERTGGAFGGTTKDGEYTLRGLDCAGACALAPVGRIDGRLVGRLTEERLKQMLAALPKRTAEAHRA
jgi:NADH:ubiquinone oxidoreductase subunit E